MKNLFYSTIILTVFLYSCQTKLKTERKFIEVANMDSSVKPGDNFFLFVNGKWVKNAVIPSTESDVGAFLDLYNVTKEHLRGILDSVAKGGSNKGSIEQKSG